MTTKVKCGEEARNETIGAFITRNTRILFHKAHFVEIYMLYFSHVKKAHIANQNGVQLFFTCESITNQRCKGLCEPIRIVHRLHSKNFSDLAAFLAAAPPNFSCEGRGKL